MSFINFKDIKRKDRSQAVIIKTKLHEIDKKIIGLELGQVSIISGTNGSGKSTLLGQIALNAVEQGYHTGIFSGEMSDWRLKNWILLQAAGKRMVQPAKDFHGNKLNYFVVPNSVTSKIDSWLDNKLYVYDNNAGNRIDMVGRAIQDLVTTNTKVKLIIIDNLMCLSSSAMTDKKYEAQKQLILQMCELAKKTNIHILFVMHPTKVKDFIRKEDISGSSDLANAVDNIFIVHRNTTDFKKRTQDFFGWKESNEIYNYDNIIEICKNREDGVIERLYGFYFETESKRFLNYKLEEHVYPWNSAKQMAAGDYNG